MPSRLWGPWTVIFAFTVAGGLIGGDIALWPWDRQLSFVIPVVSGLLTGGLAGAFIAWFVRQMDEIR
jgi:hypothetical protein